LSTGGAGGRLPGSDIGIAFENFFRGDIGTATEQRRVVEDGLKIFWYLIATVVST